MTRENILDQKSHFAFGRNWLDYAKKIDEPQIAQAMADLQRLCGRESLDGQSFLDIGCGSGLHSVAALRLGARRVIGVDIDPDAVTASRGTLVRFAPGTACQFDVCSVFEMTTERFGDFDIVYSWGVLHHTGDMVRAIESAARLVKPGGEFLLALYKKTPFCSIWRSIKRWYSHAKPERQAYARAFYIFLRKIASRLCGRNFEAYVTNYGKNRGMNFYNDVHDWLGGYPYESISPDECHALLAGLGFAVEREFIVKPRRYLPGLLGSGCDEYAFRRTYDV